MAHPMHLPHQKFITSTLIALVYSLGSSSLSALTVTGYSNTINDRFSSGFPTSPIFNTSPSFVGTSLDWSSIAWSTTTYESNSYKGLAMLSPVHFLTAQHYEYLPSDGSDPITLNQRTQGLRVQGIDTDTHTSGIVSSINNLGHGAVLLANNGASNHDLAIGTLENAVTNASNIHRLATLDLNNTSNTDTINNYDGLDILLYGRSSSTNGSPRVANTTIDSMALNGGDTTQPIIVTLQTDATFVLGDSGSPALHVWTNPDGIDELTVLGLNSAVSASNNFISSLPVAGAINNAQAIMNIDGYAMRLAGNSSRTWTGLSSTNINNNGAWTIGNSSDRYVLFDASTASNHTINLNINYNLRGLYFKSAAGTDPFTFSGIQTLTIGRGGITNYDSVTQNFIADIALGSSQYWATGSGGISVVDLDTNGHLLELSSTGTNSISGSISDGGSLALSGGTLTLSGNSSYTGKTWVHEGTLHVSGNIDSSASITIDEYGVLIGSGAVPSISGSGSVSPGDSPGILSAPSIDPADGLDFQFEFTAASAPQFNTATSSINDLIRLTGAGAFTSPLTTANTLSIYLNVPSVTAGQAFLGGFFTDLENDFGGTISNASIEIYLADGSGPISFNGQTYSVYEGPFVFTPSTQAQSADFGSGVVNGQIMQILVEPDQTQYAGWKLYHNLTGMDALDTADTDFDGIPQLHEFAFGGAPNDNNLIILPTHTLIEDGDSKYLELSATRPIGLQGIIYTPRTTTDLTNWPVGSTDILDANPTPVNNLDGTETLTYRRSQAVSAIDEAFIRIDISEAP